VLFADGEMDQAIDHRQVLKYAHANFYTPVLLFYENIESLYCPGYSLEYISKYELARVFRIRLTYSTPPGALTIEA